MLWGCLCIHKTSVLIILISFFFFPPYGLRDSTENASLCMKSILSLLWLCRITILSLHLHFLLCGNNREIITLMKVIQWWQILLIRLIEVTLKRALLSLLCSISFLWIIIIFFTAVFYMLIPLAKFSIAGLIGIKRRCYRYFSLSRCHITI